MKSNRELTHPSWRRSTDQPTPPRESLMSQMVRAQLIFDRRTPPLGLPAWRDSDTGAVSGRLDARVGEGAADFLPRHAQDDSEETPPSDDEEPSRFADELAERLQLARDRVEAEHVHLTQVGSVADAYLGRPILRLVK